MPGTAGDIHLAKAVDGQAARGLAPALGSDAVPEG